jgi:hypothetical protein
MAPANRPSVFDPTSEDIQQLIAASAHLGSKNLQVWCLELSTPWMITDDDDADAYGQLHLED